MSGWAARSDAWDDAMRSVLAWSVVRDALREGELVMVRTRNGAGIGCMSFARHSEVVRNYGADLSKQALRDWHGEHATWADRLGERDDIDGGGAFTEILAMVVAVGLHAERFGGRADVAAFARVTLKRWLRRMVHARRDALGLSFDDARRDVVNAVSDSARVLSDSWGCTDILTDALSEQAWYATANPA